MSVAKKGNQPAVDMEHEELQSQATTIITKEQLEKMAKSPSSGDSAPLDLDFEVNEQIESLPEMSILSMEDSAGEDHEEATKTVHTQSSELSIEALEDLTKNSSSISFSSSDAPTELESDPEPDQGHSSQVSSIDAVKLDELPALELEGLGSESDGSGGADGGSGEDLAQEGISLDLGALENIEEITGINTDLKTETGDLERDVGSQDQGISLDLGDNLQFDGAGSVEENNLVESSGAAPSDEEYLTSSAQIDFGIEDENLSPTKIINLSANSNMEKHKAKNVDSGPGQGEDFDIQNSEPEEKINTGSIKFTSQDGGASSPDQKAPPATPVGHSKWENLEGPSLENLGGFNAHVGQLIAQAKGEQNYHAYYDEELLKFKALLKGLHEDRNRVLKELEETRERCLKFEQKNLSLMADVEDRKIEIEVIKKRFQKDLEDMKLTLEVNLQKKQIAEARLKSRAQELEALSLKIRQDFKRIQEREKQLEGQLELLRADTSGQILSRDNKIMELKRKIDTLEFDVETMTEEEKKHKVANKYAQEKMDHVARAIRKALELLEDEPDTQNDPVKIEDLYFRRQAKGS